MPSKTPDPTPDKAPTGLSSFSGLSLRRRLSPIVRESVFQLLVERGQLWNVRGQRVNFGLDSSLCTEADFDTALGEFLERVPGAAVALADHRAVHDANARMQGAVDRATADYKRRMGFNPTGGAK